MNLSSNKILIKPLLFIVVLIGVLNFIAIKFYLFWTTTWFDMIMHFLGGFFIAMLAIFLFGSLSRLKSTYLRNLFLGLIAVLVIGTLWEVFELLAKATDMADFGYFSDTGMDYVMDLFGGLVAVWFIEHKKRDV